MKKICKKLSIIVLAVAFFLGGKIDTKAAICRNSPDGVHHFEHVIQPVGYVVNVGTHEYLYGYTADNKPIYHNDCRITEVYLYCRFLCKYCGISDGAPDHAHHQYTFHTQPHN